MAARFQYVSLADEMQDKINGGQYRAGEKLPSLRNLHAASRLSVTTVYQAYMELEKRGLVESRNKSGFFVKARLMKDAGPPRLKPHAPGPLPVHVNALARIIVEKMSEPGIINLGGATPDAQYLPSKSLTRALKSWPSQGMAGMLSSYEHPAGSLDLRREIARRTVGVPSPSLMDEIVITNGCLEAVSLCLRAAAKAGDVIAVESPTFHGLLQLIEDLDMFALEIPTDPQTGVCPDHLEAALAIHEVKACVFIPTFHNPLGALISPENRERIVSLLAARSIPLIEDDIYGDLHFGDQRPPTLKSYDKNGLVLYCSSFSKTLAPGLRIGWAMPGMFTDRVKRLKVNTNISTSLLPQYAICQYLKTGGYERHLRRLRNVLKNHLSTMSLALQRHFPKDARITAPQGGMLLWVELNEAVDSFEVYKEAERLGICFLPGLICSTTGRFKNCIRINCGRPVTTEVEQGVKELGRIIDSHQGRNRNR